MDILERLKEEFPKHTIDTKTTIMIDGLPTLIEYRSFTDVTLEDLERDSDNKIFNNLKHFIKKHIS